MAGSRQARLLITAVMNILVIVAVVLLLRLLFDFFGVLAASGAGSLLLRSTEFLVPDLGISPIRTPYGGVFDAGAAIVIGVLLVVEWALGTVRSRA